MRRSAIVILLIFCLLWASAAPAGAGSLCRQTPVPMWEEASGKLYLTVSGLVLLFPGEAENIYCGTAAPEEILWSSSHPEIIGVENGVVTARAAGEAVITAELAGERAQCTVTCLAPSRQALTEVDESLLTAPLREPPASEPGSCTFFDDAGFVGDSVTYQLLYTPGRQDRIGRPAEMFRRSATVYGFANYTWNVMFRGQETHLEDAVAQSGVRKLFIMLGANDMGFMTVEDTMKNWEIIIDRIQEKSPEVEIYIQSILPSADATWTGKLERIAGYNVALKEFARRRGLHYVEVGAYFIDSRGCMAWGFSSDGDVHITEEAVYRWSDILRLFAQRQTER